MAITDYNTILTKWPNSYPPRHNRAMCYGRLREYDKAIADYSMIIEQDLDYSNYGSPKEHAIAMAHHYRGRIFQWQKKD